MRLIYQDKEIMLTNTTNPKILKFSFQKLYYAIIIHNCNSYSSIANKQRIDVVMTDNDYNILSIKPNMHENTICKNKKASKTILLPLNYFENLEINQKFKIKE